MDIKFALQGAIATLEQGIALSEKEALRRWIDLYDTKTCAFARYFGKEWKAHLVREKFNLEVLPKKEAALVTDLFLNGNLINRTRSLKQIPVWLWTGNAQHVLHVLKMTLFKLQHPFSWWLHPSYYNLLGDYFWHKGFLNKAYKQLTGER